jgi:hypothetical protein
MTSPKRKLTASTAFALLVAIAVLALAGVSAAGNGNGPGNGKANGKANAAKGKPAPASAAAHQYGSAGKQYGAHRVALCHKGHTITIAQPAVKAHLRHGDKLGRC